MTGGGMAGGHAFISYVREDSGPVDQLQQMLEAAGIKVWRDTADLWPGEDWRSRIRNAITENALVFIACFSTNSVARAKSYQRAELSLAIEQLILRPRDVPWLIPVRFDNCVIPDDDIGGNRTLASIQRADLFGDRADEDARRLVEIVLRLLGRGRDTRGRRGAHGGPGADPRLGEDQAAHDRFKAWRQDTPYRGPATDPPKDNLPPERQARTSQLRETLSEVTPAPEPSGPSAGRPTASLPLELLPPELLQAVNSPMATVRARAIQELAKILEPQRGQKHQGDSGDPRLLLARRLRALRQNRWPGVTVTQVQLARALGGTKPLSLPLVSSWESQASPVVPPLPRLEAYAALFATHRSFTGPEPRLISPKDMSPEERMAMEELRTELIGLRQGALAAGRSSGRHGPEIPYVSARRRVISESLSSGPWYFPDDGAITVVCAQWPSEMLTRIPYTEVSDPDYIELLTYSDLDALFMAYAHLRAVNPASQVDYFRSGLMPADSYTTHLVSLGGADWNVVTDSLLRWLGLPVRQVADWAEEGGQFFEVDDDGGATRYRPVLEKVGGRYVLREDVALFARAVNPYNRARTATICAGMYGRGTYGVVRALTDPAFLERNTSYLESRFGSSHSYCLLFRVTVVNNMTFTPDWTDDDTRLFEWSGSVDGG